MDNSKGMDKIPENIGYTNPTPSLIPSDDDYYTDSSASVSGVDVRLNNDIEITTPLEPTQPEPNIYTKGSVQFQW